MDKQVTRAKQSGIVTMPAVETVSLMSIGKWLVGLILATWLWYERKRVDKVKEQLASEYYTKVEVKELLQDKLDPLIRDVIELKTTMKIMSENIVALGVTVARIDERTKRNDD